MFTLCRAKQILDKGCAHSPFCDELSNEGTGPSGRETGISPASLPFYTKGFGGISQLFLLHIGFFGKYLKETGGDNDAQRKLQEVPTNVTNVFMPVYNTTTTNRNQWNYWKV
jgi:hypothetical protein